MSGFTKEWYEAHQAKAKKPRPNDLATKQRAKSLISEQQVKMKAKLRAAKVQAKQELDREFADLCKKAGLPMPIAEHRFKGSRRWKIDYYFSDGKTRVALENEGGIWEKGGGGHNRPEAFLKNIEKYNALSEEGIYLIRTVPKSLFTQGIRDVLRVFENREQ